jgi:hypothetical protein
LPSNITPITCLGKYFFIINIILQADTSTSMHWVLVQCNVTKDKDNYFFVDIVYADSLNICNVYTHTLGNGSTVIQGIQNFFEESLSRTMQQEGEDDDYLAPISYLEVVQVKMPKQTNSWSCGPWVLTYLKLLPFSAWRLEDIRPEDDEWRLVVDDMQDLYALCLRRIEMCAQDLAHKVENESKWT